MASNSFSTGGGGPLYEFQTQAALLSLMLIGAFLPEGEDETIVKIQQQTKLEGYGTDDTLVTSLDNTGQSHRSLIQSKHGLRISPSSKELKDVLIKAWNDFNDPAKFDKRNDRIIVIANTFTNDVKDHLKTLISWSKVKSTADDFMNYVNQNESKKKYYHLFHRILLNADLNPSTVDMYEFFRCFCLWEQDFGTSAGLAYNHIINLIQLSKAPASNLTAHNIWNNIYTHVSESDPLGGSMELHSLPAHLTKMFDASYFPAAKKQLHQLNIASREILDGFTSSIASLTLERPMLVQDVFEQLANHQLVFITGDAGTGKSAIVKMIVEHQACCVIALKADELLTGNLIDLLKSKGITFQAREFFNHFPLKENYIIYVDALEKLLEDEGAAFGQLLKEIKKHPDIKLVATVRQVNWSLLEMKYFLGWTYGKVDVGVLSDAEMQEVASVFPFLKPLIANKRLEALIRVPKFLDYAYKAFKQADLNMDAITETEFMQILWDTIIENKINKNIGALPGKRGEVFMQLAILRAKKMTPFVYADSCDAEALSELVKDNVIIQSGHEKYAPSHDILEDWALIKYVNKSFREIVNLSDSFKAVGTEPAMRRGFRLWVRQEIQHNNPSLKTLYAKLFDTDRVYSFWVDESLIALLNTRYCHTFFVEQEQLLKKDDFAVYFRIALMLTTAFKENIEDPFGDRIYMAFGEGWPVVIAFAEKFREEFRPIKHEFILSILEEYAKRVRNYYDQDFETAAAGRLSLYFLEYFKRRATLPYEDKSVARCIKLIFAFSEGIKGDIESLFKLAMEMEEKEGDVANWIDERYHRLLVTQALEGTSTGSLAKVFPDLLLDLAKGRWYYKEREWTEGAFPTFREDRDEITFKYGLSEEGPYTELGAEKTFVLALLRSNPEKGIAFLIDFFNTITDTYIQNLPTKETGENEFVMLLNDGSSKLIKGDAGFWGSYRDKPDGVPNLVKSILMGLERYLLELGKAGEQHKSELQKICRKLLMENNSLFVLGVLSSVSQAYPALVGDNLIPLLTNKNFFGFDQSRYMDDFLSDVLGHRDNVHLAERRNANAMKHRRRHYLGLIGFMTEPILYLEGMGDKIISIIDKYRNEADVNDFEWRKFLDDMDLRTYKPQANVKGQDGKTYVHFQPEYADDIIEHLHQPQGNGLFPVDDNDSDWTKLIIGNPADFTLEKWRAIHSGYVELSNFNMHMHHPGALAVIAVDHLWDELLPQERLWCYKTIRYVIGNILKEKRYGDSTSTADWKPVFSALPKLLALDLENVDRKKTEKLFFDVMTRKSFNDYRYNDFFKSFSSFLWKERPEVAAQWWEKLLLHAAFAIDNPRGYHGYEKEQQEYNNKLLALFESEPGVKLLDLDSIDLQGFDMSVMAKAVMAVPSRNPDSRHLVFLNKMLTLYLSYIEEKKGFSRRNDNEDLEVYLSSALREKLSQVIFYQPEGEGKPLLSRLLQKITTDEYEDDYYLTKFQGCIYMRSVLENFIMFTEQAIGTEFEIEALDSFQKIWYAIDDFQKEKHSSILARLLLLDMKWNDPTTDWLPVGKMKDFFESLISKYAAEHTSAVINLLTYPGNEVLMPQGISLLVAAMKEAKLFGPVFVYEHAEKFAKRIYDSSLDHLKSDKDMMGGYLWMLDGLIQQGSTQCYWIREYIISFRNKVSLPGGNLSIKHQS